MHTRLRHLGAVVGLLCFVASCGAPEGDTRAELGGDDDPVVKFARQALGAEDTIQITLRNKSGYDWSSGLITLQPLYAPGSAASAALNAYLGGASAGNPTALATAAGLHLNVDAFVVPAIKSGKRARFSIAVPNGSLISFVAKVTAGDDDLVGIRYVSTGNSQPKLEGADANAGPGGTVQLGSETVSANAGNSTIKAVLRKGCADGLWSEDETLLFDDFSQGADTSAWPMINGYAFDFGGDWYTDGDVALVYNPAWGGAAASAPLPTTTGFAKYITVCPASGSLLNVEAHIQSAFTDSASDTTLVVYFFNQAGALLSIATNTPSKGAFDRVVGLYGQAIPSTARRIAVVPMAYLSAAERGTVNYDELNVEYEPSGSYTTRSVATDAFTTADSAGQPTGWAETGGDWFKDSPNWVSLWNPALGANQYSPPPVTTQLSKSFTIGSHPADDLFSARIFTATTFTDPTSTVKLRLRFNDGTVVTSSPQGRGWGNVDIWRVALPDAATSVTAEIEAFLGPAERSSFYVDNLSLSRVTPPND